MENAGAEEANANDSATTDVGLLHRACGDQPSSSLTAGHLDSVLMVQKRRATPEAPIPLFYYNDFANNVTRPQLRAALLQKAIDANAIRDGIDMNPATELRDQTADDAGNDPADDEQDERAQNVGDCSEKARHAGGQTGNETGGPVGDGVDVHRCSPRKHGAKRRVMMLGSLGEERLGDDRIRLATARP